MNVLTVNGISKRFKKKVALNNVSCEFSNGITALLGPNGAGKSTLMNIMCTLLSADGGAVQYNGCDIKQLKSSYLAKISMQFQNQPIYKNYTANEYLQFCGSLKNMTKAQISEQGDSLLEYFGIADNKAKKIATFSGGMKQRLALCGTFLGKPEIIFLDEPSAGLDIYEREELKNLLCGIKKETIIIISTHIVSDVENIADKIVLLNDGKISVTGTQQELVDSINGSVWELPDNTEIPLEIKCYNSNGKTFCVADKKPLPDSMRKNAELTDVYFSYLSTR